MLRFSAGDFLAKILHFLTFIYLARVLDVAAYGVLEFANSSMTYFLLLADCGLELWATREAAQGKDVKELVSRIVPLRLLLAVVAFSLMLGLLPVFPNFAFLRTVLILFGLTLFTQALNLKWVFFGREKIRSVVAGLILAQIAFAIAVFAFIRSPAALVYVPILRLAADFVMVAYFSRLFWVEFGGKVGYTLKNSRLVFKAALTMGAAHGLATVNYNFDSVLIGFMLNSIAVGLYNAAYRPVTMAVALPVSYFLGLLPLLSRIYVESQDTFRATIVRSLRWTATLAMPIGIGGTFLAYPIIDFLFGPAYAEAAPALQVLCWSAVLVILRGTYRQAFNATGNQRLDLRCATASTTSNLCLNLLLIPRYGILGAAVATLAAEILWLTTAATYFYRRINRINLLSFLFRPAIAAVAMGIYFFLVPHGFWMIRALLGVLIYFGILLLLGQAELRELFSVKTFAKRKDS